MLVIKAEEKVTNEGISKAIKAAIQFLWANYREPKKTVPSSMCAFRRRPPGFPARYYLQPHTLEDCVRVRPRTHAPSTYTQFANAG